MRYCRQCGAELRPSASFCVDCGAAADAITSALSVSQRQRVLEEEMVRLEAQSRFAAAQKAVGDAKKMESARIAFFILVGGAAALIFLVLISGGESPEESFDYANFTPEGFASIIKQAEECHTMRNKKCVQRAAEILVQAYEARSQRDGVDRSVVIQKWTEVMVSGDLGYKPMR